MLESGFITAALAFVGILPAREIEMTPKKPRTSSQNREKGRVMA